MLESEPTTGLNETRVPLGDGDGDTGGNKGPPARRGQGHILPGNEVDPGVTEPRVAGKRKVGIEAKDRQIEHRRNVAHPGV